jgi:hypothetical protein
MSQPPTPYARIFDFEAFSTNNPGVQQPGVQFEGEFDCIKLTLDTIIARLAEIQRTDGKILVSAFDNTSLLDDVSSTAYSRVYAQIYPLVTETLGYKNQASGFAANSANSAAASAASAATALQHKNAAQATISVINGYLGQALIAMGSANAAAGTAQSAATEANSSKAAALAAKHDSENILSSVQQLKQSLDNQYDNMLDADQNLSDVSSKTQTISNLGLEPSSGTHRSIYNRFKSFYHMYVATNQWGDEFMGNISADSFLYQYFGLSFNSETGLFINAPVNANVGFDFGTEADSLEWEVTTRNKNQMHNGSWLNLVHTVDSRLEVLKNRLSIIPSLFRNTMLQKRSSADYGVQERILTFHDLYRNSDEIRNLIWGIISGDLGLTVTNEVNQRFNTPQDGKLYGIRYGSWSAVDESAKGIANYDNYKTYAEGDQVYESGAFYRFNAYIGAAGYGPITHPAAWTMIGGSSGGGVTLPIGISDVTLLQTALDGKASSTHTHSVSDVSGLQTALDGKAASSHTHSISNVTNLQTTLDGKASTTHTHGISDVTGLQTALDGKSATSHTHSIANVSGLQTALNDKVSSSTLTAALSSKANVSHSHAISDVTGLSSALSGKADTGHSHGISDISGLNSELSSKVPITLPCGVSYDKDSVVYAAGTILTLGYDGGTDGTVTVYGSTGDRFFFYQSVNSTHPIRFVSANNFDNKVFTKGPRSWVEGIITPDGLVVHGDLTFPPNGYLISSSCDSATIEDALYQSWTGNFYSNNVYADGNGGTYSSSGYNQNGCWYPYGFCISTDYIMSQDTLSWSGLGSSGTFVYHKTLGNVRADGNGGTYLENSGNWYAQYSEVIYDGGNGNYIRYDGNGGFYISYPSYGTYLGNFGGFLYANFIYTNEQMQAGTYTEDRYADGNGGFYSSNRYDTWYPWGTYLGNSYGYNVYSDGYGGTYY